MFPKWSQGVLLTSLGSLLAPSWGPFGPPRSYLGAPWPHYWHAKAPLERDFTNLGLPNHISGRIFIRISMIFHEFWQTFLVFSVSGFPYFLILICFIFFVVFPIPPNMSKASMPTRLRASEPPVTSAGFAKRKQFIQNMFS